MEGLANKKSPGRQTRDPGAEERERGSRWAPQGNFLCWSQGGPSREPPAAERWASYGARRPQGSPGKMLLNCLRALIRSASPVCLRSQFSWLAFPAGAPAVRVSRELGLWGAWG